METTTDTGSLTGRDRAILRAVAAGRAELGWGSEPDLFLDGRCCCDQPAAHRLARIGMIARVAGAPGGRRVTAVVTDRGRFALAA